MNAEIDVREHPLTMPVRTTSTISRSLRIASRTSSGSEGKAIVVGEGEEASTSADSRQNLPGSQSESCSPGPPCTSAGMKSVPVDTQNYVRCWDECDQNGHAASRPMANTQAAGRGRCAGHTRLKLQTLSLGYSLYIVRKIVEHNTYPV